MWTARRCQSIAAYVIVNKRLANLVDDVHMFRGKDIVMDHYLAVSKETFESLDQNQNKQE